MKKTSLVFGICLALQTIAIPNQTFVYAQQETPAYAKWGQLAMKETQAKYPNAKIIDYLHVGRETKEDYTIETFKLWLKEGAKEFGVYVKIQYVTQTEKIVSMDLQETSQ